MSRNILLLLIVLNSIAALALDPDLRMSQYAHTSWRLQDGVFNGIPTAIVQTPDGYLWIGTTSGLMRFDGVRFVPWTPRPEGPALAQAVYSLGAGRDGSLWIGSSKLMRWKDGKLSNYPNLDARINAILEDPAGGVWVTRSRIKDGQGPLCHISDERIQCFGSRDGISIPYAGPLFHDTSGTLWLGGSAGLARGMPGSFETFVPPALKPLEQLSGVTALANGPNGSMLIGMGQSGRNMGLQEFKTAHWSSFAGDAFDGSTLQINNLLTDRSGSLWIGTVSQGLCVVRGRRIDYFRNSDGLSSNVINAIYEDRENNIWVVTSGGLDRFRVPKVVTFSSREGLSSDYADSVVATADGTVWVGNHDALDEIHDGAVSSIRAEQGLPGKRVTVLLEDHLGRLWVGVDNTLSVRERGRFHTLSRSDGNPVGTLQGLIEDRNGDLWGIPVPNSSRLIHIHGFSVREEPIGPEPSYITSIAADPSGGIRVGFRNGDIALYANGVMSGIMTGGKRPVYDLHPTSDGHVLNLTSGELIGWQNGKPQSLGLQNGVPCNNSYTFILDRQGTLWLYSSCGLIEISNKELQRWWNDPKARLQYSLFDIFDGAQGADTSFTPTASEAPDGKLWFVNGIAAQMIDPKTLPTNGLAPPVHIESLIADRKSYPLQQALRLPPLTRDLEIDYTGLSFVVPQKVQFRYRLEGSDKDWQDPRTRRQAFYANLHPGQYRFQVIACNNDGVWNDAGAVFNFVIPPTFVQSSSFKVICVAAFAAFLLLAYHFRMTQVTRQVRARMSARAAEREAIARDLHDTFFQSIQGLLLRFHTATSKLQPEHPAREMFEDVLKESDDVMAEGRDLLVDLHATTSRLKDLPTALADYGEQMRESRSSNFTVAVNGMVRPLHPIIFEELSRIGKEAIGNAFRHSTARSIEAELNYEPDELRMRIRDDGSGIDANVLKGGHRDGHLGLPSMRARAKNIGAHLDLWSGSGMGTEIEVRVPASLAYSSAQNGDSQDKPRRFSGGTM